MKPEELVGRIRSAHIPHPNYERALKRVCAHTLLMPEGHVIALVGPTRVGKTTLMKQVRESLDPARGRDNEIAAAYVQVETTDRGQISTRYLFAKILKALEHPFHNKPESLGATATETSIRLRIPYAIKARNTRTLILDEAHHLLRMRSKCSAGAALDSLKCLGNETGLRILLAGGYELLTTCFASAHLNGRLTVIDLPRYTTGPTDAYEFDRLLATYDEMLPWSSGASLFNMRQFIYDGSLGCCGLISNWIQAAVAFMVAEGETRLKISHFRATRFEQQLEEIRAEIALGESLLSYLPSSPPSGAVRPTPRKRRYPPGKRNPIRDKVGEG